MSFITFEHEGRKRRLAVVRTADGVWIGWPGGAKLFRPERSGGTARGQAPEEIRAPMTGKIVKIAVGSGDTVAANDVVIILEAMKMEYRLAAPHAGQVEAILCHEGDLVDLGATLVRLAAGTVANPGGGRQG